MASDMFKKLEEATKEAMKAHDNLKRDCLRTILSDIKNQTVNAGKEMTDDICLKVLQKSVKTHNDSIEQFTKANRNDLVEKEKAEVEVINSFLPKMLNNNEIEDVVKAIVQKLADKLGKQLTKKDMGIIMKEISSCENASSINMKVASKVVALLLV